MTDRLLKRWAEPPPASTPRRHLKHDERFDVIETFEVTRAPASGLKEPRLVSSAHGPIAHVMLWYPGGTRRATFEDLLSKLPATTLVTMAAEPGVAAEAEEIAAAAPQDVSLVTTPDHLNFSVWAEDACVVVEDRGGDGSATTYLVEPYSFTRFGDAIVVDLVAQASDAVASTQVPLSFQGGNVLIGDDFVLIGRDYLDETIELGLVAQSPIEGFPRNATQEEMERYTTELFRRTLDPSRDFHFLASTPTVRPGDRLVEVEGQWWVETFNAGWGHRQPIFHIDMFVSLAGRAEPGGPYRVVVGDPSAANAILKWDPSPLDLQSEFDEVADQLGALGFEVHRSPLPLMRGALPFPLPRPATLDDGTTVQLVGQIGWYHPTSSNCLVQIDGDARDVWLPTYGQDDIAELAPVDAEHKRIWEGLGFTVHQLGDFHHLAQFSGALHCIKKYLHRGPVA